MSKNTSSGSKLNKTAFRNKQANEIDRLFAESQSIKSRVQSSSGGNKEDFVLFFLVGVLVSAIPFLTYAIPMYEAGGPLDFTTLFIYLINILASGLVLSATYNSNSAQTLKRYLSKDSSDASNPETLSKLRSRSVNFSFFSVNLVFMLSYLFVNFLFHGYLQEDVWTFIIVSDLAALFAFFPLSTGLYQKFEKFV
jgi:hypothetical protein